MPLLIVICLWLGFAVAWVANIVKLVHIVNDPVSGMMILRAIGIFVAPLGALLGLM